MEIDPFIAPRIILDGFMYTQWNSGVRSSSSLYFVGLAEEKNLIHIDKSEEP